jgi:hypothetical protein
MITGMAITIIMRPLYQDGSNASSNVESRAQARHDIARFLRPLIELDVRISRIQYRGATSKRSDYFAHPIQYVGTPSCAAISRRPEPAPMSSRRINPETDTR